MTRNRTYLHFVRQLLDYMVIIFSFVIASYYSTAQVVILKGNQLNEIFLLLTLFFTWYFSTSYTNLYDEFRSRNFSFELIILLKNIFIQFIAVIVLIFMIKEINYSRLFVFYYIFFLFILLLNQKYLLKQFLKYLRRKGRNIRSILIIGAGKIGQQFYTSIIENPHFGYSVIGFLDDSKISFTDGIYLGPINSLKNILRENSIDNVIVALPNYATDKIRQVIHTCRLNGTEVRIIPDYFKFVTSNYSLSLFGKFPIVAVNEEKINHYFSRLIKRMFDLFFSSLVIILLLSWLFPIIALIIKLDSKGPVIFKQERWGRNNHRFLIYKFRTMVCNSKNVDENGSYVQAAPNDPRTTRIGKFLRKTNIDELLQFINVFNGQMSVVGPRPHPTPLNKEAIEIIDCYLTRHLVKPGITGWAQVNGFRGETRNRTKMVKRVEFDIWYIENWSFWLDLQIIFLTIWRMLKGDPNAY